MYSCVFPKKSTIFTCIYTIKTVKTRPKPQKIAIFTKKHRKIGRFLHFFQYRTFIDIIYKQQT